MVYRNRTPLISTRIGSLTNCCEKERKIFHTHFGQCSLPTSFYAMPLTGTNNGQNEISLKIFFLFISFNVLHIKTKREHKIQQKHNESCTNSNLS